MNSIVNNILDILDERISNADKRIRQKEPCREYLKELRGLKLEIYKVFLTGKQKEKENILYDGPDRIKILAQRLNSCIKESEELPPGCDQEIKKLVSLLSIKGGLGFIFDALSALGCEI